MTLWSLSVVSIALSMLDYSIVRPIGPSGRLFLLFLVPILILDSKKKEKIIISIFRFDNEITSRFHFSNFYKFILTDRKKKVRNRLNDLRLTNCPQIDRPHFQHGHDQREF